jgi:hypothetical protein
MVFILVNNAIANLKLAIGWESKTSDLESKLYRKFRKEGNDSKVCCVVVVSKNCVKKL